VSMKKRKSILSLFPVGATHCLLSSLMLWVAVRERNMPQHNSFMKECAMMPAPLLLSKRLCRVLRRPRCINCHSQRDFPRQVNWSKIPRGTDIVRLSRLWSISTRHLYSGVGPPATAVLQSPSLSVSSSRKCKHGQKKELHVPWGKRRNLPRCPGLNSDQFR
jgi:hypothetical protein